MHREDARVVAVEFVNVLSWVVATYVPVTTFRGEVQVTVAYGGHVRDAARRVAGSVGHARAP